MEAYLVKVNGAAGALWAAQIAFEFRSIGRALASDEDALARVASHSAAIAVKALNQIIVEVLRAPLDDKPILTDWRAVQNYLHAVMAHRLNETARVLHLNAKNMLIRDEQVSEGSIDQTAIYVREVARRALELGSAAVILVHNHPSGDPTPSRADVALTREIVSALQPLGVRMHDHIVVSSTGHASLRELGLM